MSYRHVALVVAVMVSAACKRSDAVTKDPVARPGAGPSDVASPPPSGSSPLSRLVPPSRPGPRKSCPLTVEPGVAFGPVLLGETVEDLRAAGLTVKNVTDTHAEVDLAGAGGSDPLLKVSLCQGKIVDIWIDDLRLAPACVEYAGAKIAPTMPREDLEKALGFCSGTPPRVGGTFESCQGGGVYLGHGMGTFLQVRVRPKGWAFDDTCAVASDDGSPIALAAAERDSMLRQALNLAELSPYWHVTKPGRDPLRIVKTPLVPESSFMMFGSPVVWIDEAAATSGTAFFRVTALSATKTKAKLAFEYPIEGIVGTATFLHIDGPSSFRIERGEVHER